MCVHGDEFVWPLAIVYGARHLICDLRVAKGYSYSSTETNMRAVDGVWSVREETHQTRNKIVPREILTVISWLLATAGRGTKKVHRHTPKRAHPVGINFH